MISATTKTIYPSAKLLKPASTDEHGAQTSLPVAGSADAAQRYTVDELRSLMTFLLQCQRDQMLHLSLPPVTTIPPPKDHLWLSLTIPKYAGFPEKSVTTFTSEMQDYKAVSGREDEVSLDCLLPVALRDKA